MFVIYDQGWLFFSLTAYIFQSPSDFHCIFYFFRQGHFLVLKKGNFRYEWP